MEFNKYSKERQANFLKMFSLLQEVAKLDELTDEAVAKGENLVEEIFNTGYIEGYNIAMKNADEHSQYHNSYLDYHIRGFGHGIPEGYCQEIIRK